MKPPVVRFAPSPTGSLHIGSARTALFNYLFARHHGGKFLLRIEDTDRVRSTQEAVQTIIDGLLWLGLQWDGEIVSQAMNMARHVDVAHALLAKGAAYRCYCSPEELEEMRAAQKAASLPQRYDGRWRDRSPDEAPQDKPFVIRLKTPDNGETTITDRVMGKISVPNSQLDDFVILRTDGTPTFMLAVVVDDHDMGITHVIRGDDHMTNTFRQLPIYHAMGWDVPIFAHMPMILGPDGAKLSKRHGAPAVSDYRERGYLPDALVNYLLRLCWSHGDDEIISRTQAIEWFDIDNVGRSPARFDFARLGSLNAHYMMKMGDEALAELAIPIIEQIFATKLSNLQKEQLTRAICDLKPRAKTLVDIANGAIFIVMQRPLQYDEKAAKILDPLARQRLREIAQEITAINQFNSAAFEECARNYVARLNIKLGDIAQPLRAALTGTTVSPPVFSVADILGKDETLARLSDATG